MTRLPDKLLQNPALRAVLTALQAQGDHAYLVGGAVRNALLGQPVDDIDIATDATPDKVTDLAKAAGLNPVPTGIEHGTVTIVSAGQGFEVTTFRRDIETDGRRAVVAFSRDIAQDAARRDFTMNALYADPTGKVIDPLGGLDDLHARRLRFVGDPAARIREDYLRILRFFRFQAWYGREVDAAALTACAVLKYGLAQIARERIGTEIRKLLSAPDPSPAIALMVQTGVLSQVLPGAETRHLPALIAAERDLPPSWLRRLMVLAPTNPVEDLRLSKDQAKTLSALTHARDQNYSLTEAAYRLGPELATDFALIGAAAGQALPPDWQAVIRRATTAPLPIAAKDLQPALTGPAIGRGLKAAEAAWIDSDFTLPPPALITTALQAGGSE